MTTFDPTLRSQPKVLLFRDSRLPEVCLEPSDLTEGLILQGFRLPIVCLQPVEVAEGLFL